MRVLARANRSAKITSGNMVPSAAARIGLVGTSSTSHWLNVGSVLCVSLATVAAARPLPPRDAVAAASIGSRAKSGGAISAAKSADALSRTTKVSRPRQPMRPIVPTSTDATLTMRRETTSGTTVIRMAFTQSVPIGSTNETRANSGGPPKAEIAIPPARPAARATRTRLVGDMRAVFRRKRSFQVVSMGRLR